MTLTNQEDLLLLGDEAAALGAMHAGITGAYSYPGTPATEVLEYVQANAGDEVVAHWCANEKTAYEQALGVSMAGRRALVSMKHVGLNVAADPFMSSALVAISGGLVVVVGDDPGMHSSQNEQDSRYLADFARILCLEPASQQEAYDMTREAFDLSERFRIPVLVRLVTRLCHGRAAVTPAPALPPGPLHKETEPAAWTLIPVNARRQWRRLLDIQPELQAYSEASDHNVLDPGTGKPDVGVITTGLARNHYLEVVLELEQRPAHLHIGVYPPPDQRIRDLARRVEHLLMIEEGYPFLERRLRGILRTAPPITGKESGALPLDGELTPDLVREALDLPERPRPASVAIDLPARPPQLCKGCPHADSFASVRMALQEHPDAVIPSDIGCYALGALPPYEAIESCVCMGASIGMGKGAADAGMRPVLSIIGDSTFLHSGITPLIDAVASDTDMTVLILDNETVAMTGLQPTVLSSSRLEPIVLGVGVPAEHVHSLEIKPHHPDELAAVLRKEMAHPGVSVIVAVRECVELTKHKRREARSS